ncbi:putative Polysaccharide deacetylase [Nitrospira japonica]|uniref:Putative Polysaccharide deacetylase n=1 Tax=Nitrospira japonica TaxID=1325564 RepID=A0A1W1IB55_9BACT|nr:XrtA system polysaccharide deacetylase [Nitrospira japonica]SLM50232.1 putative Polysaccharide deacetylase [Nitrospira japonica]
MNSAKSALHHGLSFDVEEHFQVSAFWSENRRQQWDSLESRVENNTRRIADILAAHDMKATFFVLGWVAERHPELIRSLSLEGHEIASHGYSHELVTTQTPESFRADIRKAKQILENAIGKPILGYRAPSFSITNETRWALEILVEEGYVYDSSVFPIVHDRYGMPGAEPHCHRLATKAGFLWEVPPSTIEVFGLRWPVAGGGYFRLIPYIILRRFLKRIERARQPLVMYLHPWELDPAQPRMEGSLLSRFRHYNNLHKTEPRLVSLLSEFRFGPIQRLIEGMEHSHRESLQSAVCG